jgi:hypothetical protein
VTTDIQHIENFFEIFGLPVAYSIDENELTKIYFQKQMESHPDVARDFSKESEAAVINLAYKILLDPIARAEHFLQLHGVAYNSTCSAFASEMFDISEKYSLLTLDSDRKNFCSALADRMLEIISLLYKIENDLPEFGRQFCLLRFMGSFLEKAGVDVYSRH